jgi:long-chain acyl-CoA synthetase
MEQHEDTTKINLIKNLGDLIVPSDKEAIIETSGNTITFNSLEMLAQSVAGYLLTVPKSNIGIIANNSINFIAAYLGILKAGHTAVLISSKFPKSTVDYILKDSKINLVFTDQYVDGVDNINIRLIDQFVPAKINSYMPANDDVAVILYTSGSTGQPKGVKLTHSNHRWILEKRVETNKFSLARIIVAAPCYHMNGLSVLESSLLGNATAILMPSFEVSEFVNAIEKYSVNLITSVPSMMVLVTALLKEAKKNLPSVKQIVMASAPVSKQLYQQVKETFPSARIKIAYGITEVGPGIFGQHPKLPTPEMSVGYPIPGIEYRLVNSVLEIKSPSMLKDYTNLSSKLTDDGYFVTGDTFTVDKNGFYFFQSRIDDMFVSGGHNIYPSRIEEILEVYTGVDNVVVFGLEDQVKGYKPYAFVKLNQPGNLDSVKDYALKNLPIYEMPRQFFEITVWPLTPIGKIDKKALIEIAKEILR